MPRNPKRKLTQAQRAEHAQALANQIHKAHASRGGLPWAVESYSIDELHVRGGALRESLLTDLETGEIRQYINTVLQYAVEFTAKLDSGETAVWYEWEITDSGVLARVAAEPAPTREYTSDEHQLKEAVRLAEEYRKAQQYMAMMRSTTPPAAVTTSTGTRLHEAIAFDRKPVPSMWERLTGRNHK